MPHRDVSGTVLVHWVTDAAAVHGGLRLIVAAMLLLADRGAKLVVQTNIGKAIPNYFLSTKKLLGKMLNLPDTRTSCDNTDSE